MLLLHIDSFCTSRAAGFVSNFRVDPPLLPAQCFQPISPASNNHSPARFFDEATYTKRARRRTQKRKNSEVTTTGNM